MSLRGLRTLLSSTSHTSEDRSSCSGQQSIPASPSFSDFSMGVGGETEFSRAPPSAEHNPFATFSNLHRGSMDTARSGSDAAAFRPSDSGTSSSIWGRLSMDSAMSPRASKRPSLATASMAFPGASPSFHPSPAMSIPQLRPASADNHGAAADGFAQTAPTGGATEAPRRRTEGKIDGMDYYGWCELLRSSSL